MGMDIDSITSTEFYCTYKPENVGKYQFTGAFTKPFKSIFLINYSLLWIPIVILVPIRSNLIA